MLQTTSLAPPFTLPDQNGTLVSLAGLRGRWIVLYFYPRDDTPGCTIEACEFTSSLPAFSGLNAEVIGCSADDATSHTAFISKHKLGIRLLTDADRSVMKTYGAFGKKMLYGKEVEGVIRSTVLIAPDGTVAHHWETVKAEGHAEQVRNKLMELQGHQGTAPVQKGLFDTTAQTRETQTRETTAATKTTARTATAKKPAKVLAATRTTAKKVAAQKRTAKTSKEAAARKSPAKKRASKKPTSRKAGRVSAKASTKPQKKSKA